MNQVVVRKDQYHIHVQEQFNASMLSQQLGFFITKEAVDGKQYCAKIDWVEISEAQAFNGSIEATITESYRVHPNGIEGCSIIQSLKQLSDKLKLTNDVIANEAQLEAIKNHLEDMRSLVFDKPNTMIKLDDL